jgi:hypothetical protein
LRPTKLFERLERFERLEPSAYVAAADDPDGLILVIGLLSESETRKKARR